MTRLQTPLLDPRNAERVFTELTTRRPAYLPEWIPANGQSGWALLQIFSRYMQVIIDRLNQAPDKNRLAFLDMLGLSLIPAQAARAPVVFQPLPVPVDGQIPARTRLGAKVPGRKDPVIFETEGAMAMAAARLVQVVTLWPTRDEYADHSQEVAGGRPFTLFHPRQPVLHEFYLAHNTLLAFAGEATVEVEFELATRGSDPLNIVWHYWDGQIWRPFQAFDSKDSQKSQDGTNGLTRSGVVTLRAECGESKETTVNGIKAYWIRGRLEQPLPPDPAPVLPEVDRIRLRTAIVHPGGTWKVTEKSSSGGMSLHGKVTNQDGPNLPEAHVKVGNEAIPFYSGMQIKEDGQYEFTVPPNMTYQLSVGGPEVPGFKREVHVGTSPIQIDFLLSLGLQLDGAFADGLQLDVSKTFFPLGQIPRPGTSFYFSNQEIFSKPGATMRVWIMFVPPKSIVNNSGDLVGYPEIVWEYWNRHRWAPVVLELVAPSSSNPSHHPPSFTGGEFLGEFKGGEEGIFNIKIPQDMSPREVNQKKGLWMRARLAKGTFDFKRTISYQIPDPVTAGSMSTIEFSIVETVPPALADMRLGYEYYSPWERPEHCLTYNDFQFEEHSHHVRWPGGYFPPFRPVKDTTPVFYLGFDRPLPNDFVSLYLNLQESDATTSPLVWEAWDGLDWRELSVVDETAGLHRPGMVSFIPPDVSPRPEAGVKQASGTQVHLNSPLEAARFKSGDQVVIAQNLNTEPGDLVAVQQVTGDTVWVSRPLTESYPNGVMRLAALPRFGIPRDWVRARMKDDGVPEEQHVNGLYLNATWATQLETFEKEVLGSGSGQPNQVVFFRHTPVLPGEQLEVRELKGERAEVEYPILREELLKHGLAEEDIQPVVHPRSGRVTEVWVRWTVRPHLFFSRPEDRHYVLERASGRIMFGDGQNGRLPTVGADNIRVQRYEAGGGLVGNVPAGAISQLLSGVLAQGVTNPRTAEGGADGELPASMKTRGPLVLRHRSRSMAAGDYEALSREASPGVAIARALPATAPNGRPAPGWVTVIIVPQSQDPQPQPSFELRRQVYDYLAARAPVSLDPKHLAVIGPTYLPVGVAATVVPWDVREAGAVESRMRSVLALFLHPLFGGPEGCGWPFGRDVYLSDIAAILEAINGVDYIKALDLLLHDTPQGESVPVPTDRIVVAGALQVEMKAEGQ